MSGTIDPSAEQSVVAAVPVLGSNPVAVDTAVASERSEEAKLMMTSNLSAFLHRGRS
jgi:hypothetical protein